MLYIILLYKYFIIIIILLLLLITKKVYSFMMCIAKSSNTILQSILNSDALYTSHMYQHWRSVLYLYHFLFIQTFITTLESVLSLDECTV